MAQCFTTMTPEDLDHMFLQAPEVIQQVRSNGAVTDELLDMLKIAKLSDGAHINRDSLVTWRQHAHVMSHVNSKAKFINYRQMRADRNNPALLLHLKQQEAAAKYVARETAAREKAAAVISERCLRAAEKVAEKERRQGLTPAEAKAEAVERKADCALKKARILESDERLRAALAVIGAEHLAEESDNTNDDNISEEDEEI